MAEPKTGQHVERRLRLPDREFLEHIAPDNPEFAGAIANEGRDVVVPHEHEVRGEIAGSRAQTVLAAFDAETRFAQQVAAELRKTAGTLQRYVDAAAINQHCRPPACRWRGGSPDAAPDGESAR